METNKADNTGPVLTLDNSPGRTDSEGMKTIADVQRLEAEANPWGLAGTVPTDPGFYYATMPGDERADQVALVPLPGGKRAWIRVVDCESPFSEAEMRGLAGENKIRFKPRFEPILPTE